MNNYIALTKVLLKTGLNMGSLNMNRKKNGKLKKPMSPLANMILSLVICLPLAFLMGTAGMGLYTAFSQTGALAAGYGMLADLGAIMVLVFSIPYVLSVFFMSSDLQALLPLPLKPSQIIAAKFTSVLVYEYLIIVMFYAPMLIGFGIAAGAGILFWVLALISILVLPITPIIYASFLSIIMMRLLKNVKNKEMITTIGTFLMVFVVMIFSMSIGSMSGSMADGEDMAAAMSGLAGKAGALSKLGIIFPNGRLLAVALADSNILMMMLYLLSVAVLMGVFLFLSEKLYFGGVKGMHETGSKKKRLTKEQLITETQAKNPKHTFLRKELKTLFRSPEYLTNCIMMPFIFPLIMCISMGVPLFAGMKDETGSLSLDAMIGSITQIAYETRYLIILVVVFALAALVCGSNFTTSTCLSREGRGFTYMKSIPMPYRDQLEAKSWCGLFIGMIASTPYVLLLTIGSVVLLKLKWDIIVLGLLVSFFTMLFCNYIQLWFDLRSPKLDWENEQGAVRQNYMTAISMFAIFILCGILGGVSFALYKVFNPSLALTLVVAVAVLIALSLAVRAMVLSYGERKMTRLE